MKKNTYCEENMEIENDKELDELFSFKTDGVEKDVYDFAEPEKEKKEPMGMGILGDPGLIFARQFRVIFAPDGIPKEFIKDVSIDYFNKIINLSVYDVAYKDSGFHAFKWVDDLEKGINNHAKMTYYDGCGTALFEMDFYEIEVTEFKEDCLKSDSSDVSTPKLSLKYKNSEKRLVSNDNYFKNSEKLQWELEFPDGTTYNIDLIKRPSIEIAETEIGRLNAKIHLPGKFKTIPFEVKVDKLITRRKDMNTWWQTDPKKMKTIEYLKLNLRKGFEILETTTLESCFPLNFSAKSAGDTCKIAFNYRHARFESNYKNAKNKNKN